ncbi:hypothetical protein K7X08_031981 [Anisodus acutangulus]|uniref:Uncharacterized protein n=1 Tax=Anisodus acutangulus TaxID=402998 RepID=A0A9Q1MN73_9SOLA|nr:hypothetical protein K7X08_031981 [Anisodus acutangulus]
MVHIPPVNSKVFYFPQGLAEHTCTDVDFTALPRIPAMILCRVDAVKFLADPETDEIYAKIRLIPVENKGHDFEDDTVLGSSVVETTEKPASFAKTLTQLDATNGGGFSVPRHAQFGVPLLDFHLSKKLHLGVLPPVSQPVDADSEISNGISKVQKESNENVSCLLTMGISSQMLEKADNVMRPRFLLFG